MEIYFLTKEKQGNDSLTERVKSIKITLFVYFRGHVGTHKQMERGQNWRWLGWTRSIPWVMIQNQVTTSAILISLSITIEYTDDSCVYILQLYFSKSSNSLCLQALVLTNNPLSRSEPHVSYLLSNATSYSSPLGPISLFKRKRPSSHHVRRGNLLYCNLPMTTRVYYSI